MKADSPEKIIIEPTTRCNFKCEMCVKQAPGCRIEEGDLTDALFDNLKPLIPGAESVIFTGIGEPLLHSGLERYISYTRENMKPSGRTGFQTNGKLLTGKRAESIVAAGTDVICISVDSSMPGQFRDVRNGGELADVENAFDAVRTSKKRVAGSRTRVGVEFVLMKKNLHELPEVILWAERQGAEFVMVTHLTPYDAGHGNEPAYIENSYAARALFDTWSLKGAEAGLDLSSYETVLWNYNKTDREKALVELVQSMKNEASSKDLFIDVSRLLREDDGYNKRLKEVFNRSEEIAAQKGIELVLPEMRPNSERYCRFVEENALFVTWNGDISPCYFLWHQYACMREGFTKQVTPVFFGNSMEREPLNIWNSEGYDSFRNKVKLYDYPMCANCCFTPCSYILDEPFEQDCYTIDVPCCDCQWCQGLLNCLI